MAKRPSNSPKLSAEEQKAQLDRLTAGVATEAHVGPNSSNQSNLPSADIEKVAEIASPTLEPTLLPASELVIPPAPGPRLPSVPTPELIVATEPNTKVNSPTDVSAATTTQQGEQKGEKAPLAGTTPKSQLEVPNRDSDEGAVQSESITVLEKPSGPTSTSGPDDDKLDLMALFAASAEKRTFQVRITPALQQFFQQVGSMLGNGASSADIIHNILTQFRAKHEAQITRALQKQLRQMLKNNS